MNSTSSIRISNKLKQMLKEFAKEENISLVKLNEQALSEFLERKRGEQRVRKWKKLQEESQKYQPWSAEEEIAAIKASRVNKVMDLE